MLIDCGGNVHATDKKHQSSVIEAVRNTHIETVELMIQFGVDITAMDRRGRTALHVVVIDDYYEMVKLLIEYGLDAKVQDEKGRTAFDIAKRNPLLTDENKKIVEQLESIEMQMGNEYTDRKETEMGVTLISMHGTLTFNGGPDLQDAMAISNSLVCFLDFR